jgi:hypothetical protein
MTEHVRMTVEWDVGPDRLAVTYRVANGGAEPVYVIDGRFRAGPGGVLVWSDRLKVGFRPPATAVLGSTLMPLKPAVHSTFPPTTFAVRLAAGEGHENTLTAPLPLVPDGTVTEPVPPALVAAGNRVPPPFADEPPQLAGRLVLCRAAVFELGVVPHRDALRPQPVRLADRSVYRLDKAAWSLQRIATVESHPGAMQMLVPATFAEQFP